ncbi:T-lymphocyte surface antigen Ly-9-like [Tachysurus fulvidraco]|uniref:T-lymphocyte surface antigen Ly-9-like n=1 Tax=Tachysurus fulvidraco TaxID=1234273 RepID=UPI001FEEC9BA|nr:T-lymphocyte surface antigen Ly-9-like [Tachysurus fulvidraco]
MKSYLHIVAFIILNFSTDCGAWVHVVYKSIGEIAHLTLKDPPNISTIKWRKDSNLIAIVENKRQSTKFTKKYHIHVSDNSLFIHNLTLEDSGYYKAQTGQWEEDVIQYKLIVQEAVSKPVITVNHQINNSSVCYILVTCSADGDSVMYNCDHQHCTLTNATSNTVNLTVSYTEAEVLECTASNRVSTKQTSIHKINTCPEKSLLTTTIIFIISIAVFAVLLICIIFFTIPERRRNKNRETGAKVNRGLDLSQGTVTRTSTHSGRYRDANQPATHVFGGIRDQTLGKMGKKHLPYHHTN